MEIKNWWGFFLLLLLLLDDDLWGTQIMKKLYVFQLELKKQCQDNDKPFERLVYCSIDEKGFKAVPMEKKEVA